MLLIACANVANLLLFPSIGASEGNRGPSRARRGTTPARAATAHGKRSPGRARRGGGFTFCGVGRRPLRGFDPGPAGSIDLNLSLDGRMLAFTAGVSILTGIIFGLVPAWRATRTSLAPTLKDGARY